MEGDSQTPLENMTEDSDLVLVQQLDEMPSVIRLRSWAERSENLPSAGVIRPLTAPVTGFEYWWDRDRTLTDWIQDIEECDAEEISGDVILPAASLFYTRQYSQAIRDIFFTIQRQRWLARKTLRRLQQRIWSRRPQCAVDLIDMAPITPADTVTLTDTRNRAIYHFHRRDIFGSLLSNITAADEFLPTPRPPTNPWTNQPLSLSQTLAICQQLTANWAKRGACPPVLFAAFCASGYDVDRFEAENASLLGKHAIQKFFREINDQNRNTFCETIFQLLADASIHFSAPAIRRWARQTPITPSHKEWLDMARDATLWLNLHIQARSGWSDESVIYDDVRSLYNRSPMRETDTAGPRLRALRTRAPLNTVIMPISQQTAPFTFGFTAAVTNSNNLVDISGNINGLDAAAALALIQQALFRM